MDRRRAAGALLALAACIARSAAAPTASNHTSLDVYDGAPEGCYYNFQHYSEGDRIMTNEPCLNCTCHNRMLMCYLRVCPFTKPIGLDCTIEKRADQCCPIVTCPDVPVDLLTSTSTSSPAEYGGTGIGKYEKYGCSINGRYFPEGSKVPPTPNKPCEHCYCIRNMTTCVMQECTLHVDGCTPIYHKDVCCPVRYSCDHPEDEMLLLDDMSTTVRPTPGFLLTTTTIAPVTQTSQSCIHDDKIFVDGALIKTEKACEHCYCMKGDIVCVVQECGTPMENEGKNCTSLPPREGQCCPDTYICEGDEPITKDNEFTTQSLLEVEDLTTLPTRRVSAEGSGYRKETDDLPFTEPTLDFVTEGSGDIYLTTEKTHVGDEIYISTEKTNDVEAPIHTEDKQTTPIQKDYTSITDSNILDETTETNINAVDDKYTTDDSNKIIKSTTLVPVDEDKIKIKPIEEHSTESSILKETLGTDIPLSTKVPDLATTKTEDVKDETESYQVDPISKTTATPLFDEIDLITTETNREKDVFTGVTEQEASVSNAHTSSTPFLEDIEKLNTLSQEEQGGDNLITDGIDEKVSTPSENYTPTSQLPSHETVHEKETTEMNEKPHHDLSVIPIADEENATPKSPPEESSETAATSEKEMPQFTHTEHAPTEGQEKLDIESTTSSNEISATDYIIADKERTTPKVVAEASAPTESSEKELPQVTEYKPTEGHKEIDIESTTLSKEILEPEHTIAENEITTPKVEDASATTESSEKEMPQVTEHKTTEGQEEIYIESTTVSKEISETGHTIAEEERNTPKVEDASATTESSEKELPQVTEHKTTEGQENIDIESTTLSKEISEPEHAIAENERTTPKVEDASATTESSEKEMPQVTEHKTTEGQEEIYIESTTVSKEISETGHTIAEEESNTPKVEDASATTESSEKELPQVAEHKPTESHEEIDIESTTLSKEISDTEHTIAEQERTTPKAEEASATTETAEKELPQATEHKPTEGHAEIDIESTTLSKEISEPEHSITEKERTTPKLEEASATTETAEKESPQVTEHKPPEGHEEIAIESTTLSKEISETEYTIAEKERTTPKLEEASATTETAEKELPKITEHKPTEGHEENYIESTTLSKEISETEYTIAEKERTTPQVEDASATTESSEKELAQVTEHKPTEGHKEVSESEYSTLSPSKLLTSTSAVTFADELDTITETHKHDTFTGDEISETSLTEKSVAQSSTTTAIYTNKDDQFSSESTSEPTQQADLETTSPSDQKTNVPEDDVNVHITEKPILNDDTYKSTTISDIFITEPSKQTNDDLKFEEEEMAITTETSIKEEVENESIDKQPTLSISIDESAITSGAPFLEEVEDSSTSTPDDVIKKNEMIEKETPKPQLFPDEISTSTVEPDKGLNTIPSGTVETSEEEKVQEFTTPAYHSTELDINKGVSATESNVSDEEPKSTKVDDVKQSTVPEASTISPTVAVTISEDDNKYSTPSDISKTSTSTKESIQDLEQVSESITDSTTNYQDKLETTTINQIENEIDENNQFIGRIPGEGDCLLNSITYKNGSAVPKTNKCHSNCKCVSSIIRCDPIICSSPPEYMQNCQPTYDSPDSCCPTYVCDQSRETMPPVIPLVHITTTETPPAFECHGDQCEVTVDKNHPDAPQVTECSGSECKGLSSTEQNKCDSKDCIAPVNEPEIIPVEQSKLCSEKPCKNVKETCTNGACQSPEESPTAQPSKTPDQKICGNGEICADDKDSKITENKEDCSAGDCSANAITSEIPLTQKCQGDNCEVSDISSECADDSCRRKQSSTDESSPAECKGSACGEVSDIPKPSEQTPYEKRPEVVSYSEKTPDITTLEPIVTEGLDTVETVTAKLPDPTESSASEDLDQQSHDTTHLGISENGEEEATEKMSILSTTLYPEDSVYTNVYTKSPDDEIVTSKTVEETETSTKLEDNDKAHELPSSTSETESFRTTIKPVEYVPQQEDITTNVPELTKVTEYEEKTTKANEYEASTTLFNVLEKEEEKVNVTHSTETDSEIEATSPVVMLTDKTQNQDNLQDITTITPLAKLPEVPKTSDTTDFIPLKETDGALESVLTTTPIFNEDEGFKAVTEDTKIPLALTTESSSSEKIKDVEPSKVILDNQDSSTSSTPEEISIESTITTIEDEEKRTTSVPEIDESLVTDTHVTITEPQKDISDSTKTPEIIKSTDEQEFTKSPSLQSYSPELDKSETTQSPKTTKTILPTYFTDGTIAPDNDVSTKSPVSTSSEISEVPQISVGEEESTSLDHKTEPQTTETGPAYLEDTKSSTPSESENDKVASTTANVEDVTNIVQTTSSYLSTKDEESSSVKPATDNKTTIVAITEQSTDATDISPSEKLPIDQEKPATETISVEKEKDIPNQFDYISSTTLSPTHVYDTETTKPNELDTELQLQTDKSVTESDSIKESTEPIGTQTPELYTNEYDITDDREQDKNIEHPSSESPMSLVTEPQKATETSHDQKTTIASATFTNEKHEVVTAIPQINVDIISQDAQSPEVSSETSVTTVPLTNVGTQGPIHQTTPETFIKHEDESTDRDLEKTTIADDKMNNENEITLATTTQKTEAGFTASTLGDQKAVTTEHPSSQDTLSVTSHALESDQTPHDEGLGVEDVTKLSLPNEQIIPLDHTQVYSEVTEIPPTTLTPSEDVASEEPSKVKLPSEENSFTENITPSEELTSVITTSTTISTELQKTTQADENIDVHTAPSSSEEDKKSTSTSDVQTEVPEIQPTTQIPHDEEMKSTVQSQENVDENIIHPGFGTELPEVSATTLVPTLVISEDKIPSILAQEPDISTGHLLLDNLPTELPTLLVTKPSREEEISDDDERKSTISNEQNIPKDHIYSTTLTPIKEDDSIEDITKSSLTEKDQTVSDNVSTLDDDSKSSESLTTTQIPQKETTIAETTKSTSPTEQTTEQQSTGTPQEESSKDKVVPTALDGEKITTLSPDTETYLPDSQTETPKDQLHEDLTKVSPTTEFISLDNTTPSLSDIYDKLPEKQSTQIPEQQSSESASTLLPLEDKLVTIPTSTQTEPTQVSDNIQHSDESTRLEKVTTTAVPEDEKSATTEILRETTETPREEDIAQKITTTESKEQVTEKIDVVPAHINDTDHTSIPTETTLKFETTTQTFKQELHEKSTELPYTTDKVDSETTPYIVELEEHTHKTESDIVYATTQETPSVSEKIDQETQTPVKEDEVDKEALPAEIDSTKITEESSTQFRLPETTPSSQILETSINVDDSSKIPTTTLETDQSSHSTEEPIFDKKETTPAERETTTYEDKLSSTSIKPLETVSEQELSSTSTVKITEASTESISTVDKSTKPAIKVTDSPSTELPKPFTSETPIDDIASPEENNFPPSASSGYGGEPDYVEEDQAFGPGTCRYGGKVYVSAQQIPRDDPCDFCFCFRSDIICLQQSCPPPIHGCHEEPIQGFCCPRYECPVSMATTLNVTTTTTTTTTTLPPHFPTHSYKGAAQRRGCQIKGHTYKVGEVVRASSGPCLHCTCGGDGQMKCDPKACTPEPMLRQMIAAAVSTKRRR